MSRRDIAVILEKLSLDHRTSLADKACAFLQAVESNRAVKNHPSYAAICIDIAAVQLRIDVSRPALIRLSGAASPLDYSSALQKLSRLLTGKAGETESQDGSSRHTQASGAKSRNAASRSTSMGNGLSGDGARYELMRQLLTGTTMTCLRQLAVQYGSIELEELVLECLQRFFDIWIKSLTPAQRVHVNYADAKWVGAAFWLCAMARAMTVGKGEGTGAESSAQVPAASKTAKTPAIKRIGGRGGKELKDMILTAVEHTIKKTELDTTIRLIEDTTQGYLLSLRKAKAGTVSTAAASRRKEVSPPDEDPDPVETVSTARFDRASLGRVEKRQEPDKYKGIGTKRTVSNVSQLSIASDNDDGQVTSSDASTVRSAKPPLKRTRLDSQVSTELSSSADIMSTKKRATRKTLKEATADSQTASQILNQRRKTGGVYSMIPRVHYENTRAFIQYQEWRTRILHTLHSAG
ncbi:hypothetical protein KVV02_008534 [Mortierella alpina]|uniref:ORC6 second cyclin-like domain-containing protein n=1 Tax=Mortierella alpina TaxID=64518 RepID=A0A9P8AA23_MORAP|nr:hypothetical protein KVV02_008534 [Mortierella alpina]